jgi:multiple sugar transport system permease protein
LKINNLTNNKLISFLLLVLIFIALFLALFLFFNTHIANFLNNIFEYIPFLKILSKPFIGFTTQHFIAVWSENEFYIQFLNTALVTLGVVSISLTVGTLAGYALSRSSSVIAFWLLVAALVFRALPHSVLVTGYLELFIDYGLYGKKIAVIILLVAINQPFTIWMLRSFFMNIPQDLDEAAQIDGCNPFQAFWMVIMPLMWPGVITTGLFSFLLAYNDYLVCALLLDGQSQTMVPAIMQYFNMETTMTDLVESIAAAASITLPLFILVMFFQKQIVSGLTQGSVKG